MGNRSRGEVYTTVHTPRRDVEIYEGLGRIDLDDLREEIEGAGAHSIYFGVLHADARARASRAKLALDVVSAQLEREKRKEALDRAEKLTEAAVHAAVVIDPRYREAYEALIDAERDADVAESAKFTIARKQSTLENMAPMLAQEQAADRPIAPAPTSRRIPFGHQKQHP